LPARSEKLLALRRLGAEHGLEEGRVGNREVDHLFALGVLAQRGDHQIGLARLQRRDAVGAGHGHQFHRHAEFFSDVVGHVDVQSDRLEVGADIAVRGRVGRDGDLERLGLQHIVQCGLGLDGGTGQQGGDGDGKKAFGGFHSRAPR
jgi:hypothetical protein